MAETATATAQETTDSGAKTESTTGTAATQTTAATETTETKTDSGKTGTDTTSTTAATATQTAPETYDLKAPDGGYVDDADLTAVASVAKQQGWTNEQAQGALDDHAAALAARSVTFLDQTKADAEYGGDKLEKTQQLAKAVLEKVRPAGTPRGDALRTLLDKSGYGNHIEVISFLADLGKMTTEDAPNPGAHSAGSGGAKKSDAEVLYANTTSKA